MDRERPFAVVVFGATGFTGRLVAEYLARKEGLRWAIAGRDRERLRKVAEGLPKATASRPEVLVADAGDPASLAALARQAAVVATTVGPFARYGLPLVAACAEAGTHYVDITGEVPFMRASIDRYDAAARASGACIVHACGFDSVPSDLGVLLAADAMRERHGRPLGATKFFCLRASGGFSGGTVASMLHLVDAASKDRAIARLLRDPYALSPDRAAEPLGAADPLAPAFAPEVGRWVAPFLMGPVNTRVVRRSSALAGHRYGRGFQYGEWFATGRGPRGAAVASAVSAGLAGFLAAASVPPARAALERLLPKSGEGPDADARARGHFTVEIHAESDPAYGPAERVVTKVVGIGDPGYAETAKMLSEAALTLVATPPEEAAAVAGVTTPARALGHRYVERLRGAGMIWAV